MVNKSNRKNERMRKMATFATPKKDSYIVKKDSANSIIKSKNSNSDITTIKKRAEKFIKNNLNKN